MRRRTGVLPEGRKSRGASSSDKGEFVEESEVESYSRFDDILQLIVIVALVVLICVSCGFLSSGPAVCTSEEGLCTTSPCNCAHDGQRLLRLHTPQGQPCWQCVDICPSATEAAGNSSGDSGEACSPGRCECAEGSQERVLVSSATVTSPCWRCVPRAPMLSLTNESGSSVDNSASDVESGNGSSGEVETCLVHQPRSTVAPLPRRQTAADAWSELSANSVGTANGSAPPAAEPVVRLLVVPKSLQPADSPTICSSFVHDGSLLRERNTSLCLSWSASGGLWGLSKCAASGSPEATWQTFSEVSSAQQEKTTRASQERKATVAALCVQGSLAADESAGCIGVRHHVCPVDVGACTSADCECEDPTWTKHEVSGVLGGSTPCWTCAPYAAPYCATEAAVCTTTPCICEHPEHVKIETNTTEFPVRTCWSCRPPDSAFGSGSGHGGGDGGWQSMFLVVIFLGSLCGGLLLKRLGSDEEGERPEEEVPKTILGRLFFELTELWMAFEDGVAFLLQLLRMAFETLLEMLRLKSPSGQHNDRCCAPSEEYGRSTDAQGDCLDEMCSSTKSGSSRQISDSGDDATAAAPKTAATPEAVTACLTQEVLHATEAVRWRSNGVAAEASGSDDAASCCIPIEHSAAVVSPVCELLEGVDDEVQQKRKKRTKKPKTAAASADRSSQVAENVERMQELKDEAWDPLQLSCEDRSEHVQHARLLVLMHGSSGGASPSKVDKHILAARWLRAYNLGDEPPAEDTETAAAAAEKTSAIDLPQSFKKVGPGVKATPAAKQKSKRGEAREAREARREAKGEAGRQQAPKANASSSTSPPSLERHCQPLYRENLLSDTGIAAWDPLLFAEEPSSTSATQPAEKGIGCLHGRVLTQLMLARWRGVSLSARATGALWLVCNVIPDVGRLLREKLRR
eukprot:TRINITY_DN59669_c0_g1_i1.p1 TRINITY_DN59669_c0_g1~~TRINITY_DN59669_c0_g1_i1.p1  ORF type:complete len:916 (-),score=170.67 TRINITY_DN59669_c0_g1_i1:198-2945(-)